MTCPSRILASPKQRYKKAAGTPGYKVKVKPIIPEIETNRRGASRQPENRQAQRRAFQENGYFLIYITVFASVFFLWLFI